MLFIKCEIKLFNFRYLCFIGPCEEADFLEIRNRVIREMFTSGAISLRKINKGEIPLRAIKRSVKEFKNILRYGDKNGD